MPDVETVSKRETTEGDRASVRPAEPPVHDTAKPRLRIVPLLITLATVALAVPLGWAMWNAYMGAPWTRDGTVRTYVVTMAPEIAGRIVELPVVDNQFVRKGDLLMVIDPTNYSSIAEATVQLAKANAENATSEAKRRRWLREQRAVSTEELEIHGSSTFQVDWKRSPRGAAMR